MKTFLFVLIFLGFASLEISCVHRTVVEQPANVVYVRQRPAYSKVVVVQGRRYHYWDNAYYRKTRRGYMVVRP